MEISYDYTELIEELIEEIEDGILTEYETIQILRGENIGPVTHFGVTKIIAYKPIIDWYYNHEIMMEIMSELPMDVIDGRVVDYAKIKKDYKKNAKLMEEIRVKDCLIEMKSMSRIL